jgi:RNA polymerase sigma-70 factor (ECF subfamily)
MVLALKEGNIRAFNELFDRYAKRLLYFSITYLKSEEEAEEIVQDVFFKLWTNRANLCDSKSIDSYLFTIARNAILNTIRKSKSERNYLEYIKVHKNKDFLLDDELDFNELNQAYQNAIEKLSPKRKEIFKLSREKAMSNLEIATHLGISIKTVENQMTTAIADIKKTLQSLGFSAIIYISLFL